MGTRDVFSFAAAWPNGPSEKCANQLAQLTSAMAHQPVNLERRGGWGGVGRGWGNVGRVAAGCGVAQASAPTAKGEGWGWADEKRTERASDVIDVGALQSGRVN